MRERNSLVCTCTAKIETWLLSRSLRISAGISVNGRGARSSSTHARYGDPTFWISCTSAAAISIVASSVMTQTFSAGCTRRQTFTAFRAPGVNSESKGIWVSWVSSERWVPHFSRSLREAGILTWLTGMLILLFSRLLALLPAPLQSPPQCNRPLSSNLQSPQTPATGGPRRCRFSEFRECNSVLRANLTHPPHRPRTPDTHKSDLSPALPSACRNRSSFHPARSATPATCFP